MMFYLDNEKRVKEIPLGKEGEVLTIVNGVPKFTPVSTVPPTEPPIKLSVNAGLDFKTRDRSVTLIAVGNATSYLWTVIRSPTPATQTKPVATYTVTGTGNDVTLDGSKYAPGSLIILAGTFNSLWVDNLNGSDTLPIKIQNNGKVTIGNPLWAGNGRGTGLCFINCHHFHINAINNGDIQVNGSTITTINPASKEQWRAHYRNIDMTHFTDNFVISGVNSVNGGHGIVAKTDVIANNPATYSSVPLGTMVFHNMTFTNNWNEAMYIGHTATMWNIKTGQPEYNIPSGPDLKAPLRISHVVVMDNKISGCGLDSIQIAATDEVDVFGNEVTNWATQKNPAHNGAILIGGKCLNSFTQGNYIHDGWGEVFQFYGSGGDAPHTLTGNTFQNNQGDMISLRGSNKALVYITNNNVLDAGPSGNLIRVNGYTNGEAKQAIINDNVLAGPLNDGKGTVYPKNFIYLEQGATVEESGNIKANSIADIPGTLDLSVKDKVGPKPSIGASTLKIVTPNAPKTAVEGLVPGEYEFQVTATLETQTATDTIKITVE
jgi:hypothetical protein